MTILDEVLEMLSLLSAGATARQISGRAIDQIGAPVVGAAVRMLATGVFSGSELARTETDEQGAFLLDGACAPAEYVVAIEADGAVRRLFELRRPPLTLGDVLVLLPFRLSASVGDGGENRPHDVARVARRLHRLGRLSDADLAAEPIALTAAAPTAPGPRLMAALASHFVACFGRPLPVIRVERDGPTADALAIDPPFPIAHIGLAAPVGDLPGRDAGAPLNAAPSVAVVQERLHQLGVLTTGARRAELADVTAADFDPATIPETVAAIAAFDAAVTGGSLRAIVPGALNEAALNDPCVVGRRPLRLTGSVGVGGANRAVDVRRVQDRLVALNLLSPANRDTERPPLSATETASDHVAEASLVQTIAAIGTLRHDRLGEAATVAARVEPDDPALQRLNMPARLELTDTVGWGPAIVAANRPEDVRGLQDRLLSLGFLSQADYNQERVDPFGTSRVDQSLVQQTSVALALASVQRGSLQLAASVGESGANAPADVRAVQDRLHGLGVLAEADYAQERVDPSLVVTVDPTSLVATFAAIARARERGLGCPAARADEPWTAHPIVEPGDDTHGFLNDPLFYGRFALALDGSVGTFGWNFPPDVNAVQTRLRRMRLLSDADFAAELVDPSRAGRVGDLELSATRQAIARLRELVMGESGPVVERIESRSAAVAALDDALGGVRRPLDIADSVGWDGANAPADVRIVQQRLHALGFLADADFDLESQAVPAGGQARLRDYQITETIAAIAMWQRVMLGTADEPRVEPSSQAQFTLACPPLPRRVALPLTGRVGRNGVNARADVRPVQDRLFELGFIEPADYFTERVDGALPGTVAAAALPRTVAAIGRAQETIAGLAASLPDSAVDPGGRTARALEDPAWSTPTLPNPNCALTSAGPERPLFPNADLMRIIEAIEAEEGGVSSGEIPAILRNASWTPASWGAAQVIGNTGIGTLAAAANLAFASFYGLDAATLTALQAIAAATIVIFDAITNTVPANTTETALQALIDAYVAANAPTVRANTGLAHADIARMFRAAQLRRHLTALGVNGNEAVLFNAATHPDEAANLTALALTPSEVRTYLRNPAFYGEHRQGFVTRALLLSPEGQILRNALTDDSGFKIGRYVIRDNWNATPAALQARDRAQVTAYLHNHGGSAAALANQLAMVSADPYVVRVIAHYDNP